METNPPSSATGIRHAVAEGLRSARRNAKPAAVLVLLTAGLILGYEHLAPMRAAMDRLAEARERTGIGFGVVSTALFGGALPLVFRRLLLRQPATGDEILFGVCFWGYKGAELGLFYDLQAHLWGTGSDFLTLVTKVFFDQGVYCPLVAVPTMTLGYLWLDCGFSFRRTRAALRAEGYWARALPVLISNALLWVPAIFIVYTLPTALQLPLQNLILTFWVLILMLLARTSPPTSATPTVA